jgi:hypothetical protein
LNLLPGIFSLIAALLLAGCAENPPKPAFAPAGAGFSVQMPGAPQERTDPNGTHMYIGGSGKLAYIVGYHDLPPRIKPAASVRQRAFDASRDALTIHGGANLLSEQDTTLDGRPGREVKLKLRDGYFMQLKTAFNGTRLYQVSVVAPMDESTAPEIERFIDSFRFTGK